MVDNTPKARRSPAVFLLGPAGSGKTHYCLDTLITRERQGEPTFYLVPEQSTYLADRQILESPGPEAIHHARVLSFRRLASLLEEPTADRPTRTLDQPGRRILLRTLFTELPAELRQTFERVFDRPGFVDSLVATLREIRVETAGDDRNLIDRLAGTADLPNALHTKLDMLTHLGNAYVDTLTTRNLRDPDLILLDTPARIRAHPEMFRDIPVLVDGFLSFTRLEMEILLALAQTGAALTITACLDRQTSGYVDEVMPAPPDFRIDEWPRGFATRIHRPVFLAPLRAHAELRARLHGAGIATRTESLDSPDRHPRFRSHDLAQLEASILHPSRTTETVPTDIHLIATRDPSHEVEVWARQIDRWIRLDTDPVRPGEIAVIVRDLEMYRPLVVETFARFHIPVFVDQHWDLTSRPLVRTILDTIEVLRCGWQREAVLAFLRSPLLGARGGEIDLLENLSIEAGYDFEQWTGDPWVPILRPPRTRYVAGENEQVEEVEPDLDSRENRTMKVRTRIANRLRTTFLHPLAELGATWRTGRCTGTDAVTALRNWITASCIRAHAAPQGDQAQPDAIREWEAVDGVLQRIADETKNEALSLDTFAHLLRAGLTSLTLGRTPTGLDQVILAEVQHSRLGEVRRAIVGDLCARDFPRTASSGRLFSEQEREKLASLGLHLGTPDLIRQEEEAYFLYIALTRASERLLLTRPASDLEGRPLEPSPFVKEIRRAFPKLKEEIPSDREDPADLTDVQTAEELAARVGAYIASRLDRRRAGRPIEPDATASKATDRRLLTAYNHILTPHGPAEHPFLEPSSRLWGYDNHPRLPQNIVEAARPKDTIRTSASRLEAFARCPYQHFARHMLHLERRPQSEVTPLESGLLAHRALEVLGREGMPPPDRAEIDSRLKTVFDHIKEEESLRAYQVDPSGRFRMRSARGQLLRYLELETKRLGLSAFEPHRFEQEFGLASVPPLGIELPDGSALHLRGRIDRIDTRRIGETTEALVIDYKSSDPYGKQRGRPRDVAIGLDLQLAVYLLVVEEVLGMRAVGALYVPVLPRPVRELAKDSLNRLDIRMIGLLPEDQFEPVAGDLKVIRRAGRKDNRLADRAALRALLEQARSTLSTYGSALQRGHIDIAPVKIGSRSPCDYCDYASVCRVDEAYNPFRSSPLEGIEGPDGMPR